MSYLLGVIALVLGWGVFQYHKRGQAESKLDDLNFTTALKNLRDSVLVNDNALKMEEDKRNILSSATETEEKKDVTNQDALDFLNNNIPKP